MQICTQTSGNLRARARATLCAIARSCDTILLRALRVPLVRGPTHLRPHPCGSSGQQVGIRPHVCVGQVRQQTDRWPTRTTCGPEPSCGAVCDRTRSLARPSVRPPAPIKRTRPPSRGAVMHERRPPGAPLKRTSARRWPAPTSSAAGPIVAPAKTAPPSSARALARVTSSGVRAPISIQVGSRAPPPPPARN